MDPVPKPPRGPRRWLTVPAVGLALACLTPLVTAAPASAHTFSMFHTGPDLYRSDANNFCVRPLEYMQHDYWYAITYARERDSYGDLCGRPHGEPADGARLDIWWYKNGDGHGGFAFRVHWGFYHNPYYDTQVGHDCSCVMSFADGTGGPGYWSMDAYQTAADWWGNFQGGWAIDAVHHQY